MKKYTILSGTGYTKLHDSHNRVSGIPGAVQFSIIFDNSS